MGYKLTGMYMRPNGVEKQIRPKWWWQPWANTIAYFPLNATSTVNDLSGHSYSLASNWNVTFWTYNWVSCCYINVGMLSCAINTTSKSAITENIWYCEADAPNYDNWYIINIGYTNPTTSANCNWIIRSNGRPSWRIWFTGYVDETNWIYSSTTTYNPISTNTWYNLCYTYNGTTLTLYVNWQAVWTASSSWSTDFSYVSLSRSADLDRSIKGYISNAIYEDIVRTAQEVLDYYNLTKSNYWL